jgi:ABC-type transporter Mla subunit MlaD
MPLHIANAQRFMTIVANNAVNGIRAGKNLSPSTVMEASKRRDLVAAFRTLAGFSGEAAAMFTDTVREIHDILTQPQRMNFKQLEEVNSKMVRVIQSLEEVQHVLCDQLIPNLEQVSNTNNIFSGRIDAEINEDDVIFSPWFWQEGLDHLQLVLQDLREFHHDQLLLELVRQSEEQFNPVARAIPQRLTEIPPELCRYANDNGTLH